MDFNGFVIETNALEIFEEAGTDAGGYDGAMGYSISFSAKDNLASSLIEMTYYSSEKLQTPLAYLKTTLKFRIAVNIDIPITEWILYAVKTQNSFMLFMLYQKFSSMNIRDYYLAARPDKVFYDAINLDIELAPLAFDKNGNYDFG